jgi:ankyrin repeat protein
VLLAAGAAVEMQDKNKATPLHWAAKKGHTQSIVVLVSAGAYVDAQGGGASLEAHGDKKATPLHMAAMHGHSESIKALVAAGATVDARDDENATPLHWAAGTGDLNTDSL